MSSRQYKNLFLAGPDYSGDSLDDLKARHHQALLNGMHGLCFSAYTEGQQPGDELPYDQVRRRMEIISPFCRWVRSFSCIEGNEHIPKVAHELGLKTLVGAWLGKDDEKNEQEINGLIELAKAGYVDIAAVGNEVLYRNDLTKEKLLAHLKRVKEAIPDIPMGYVDAYYEFSRHPEIVEHSDVILANCYPFWEGCQLDYSLMYMKQMYYQAKAAANGKKVIITETGWPSQGQALGGATPSSENAIKYFLNTQRWSQQENTEIFYFSSFDEGWKIGSEGDVGAYWGIWDKDEQLKFM
ncbi:MAG: glycosyl hydrolase family 17 protein [Bacteroidota bacterium]